MALKWQTNYYVGEGIKNPADIKEKIDAGKMTFRIYLVTLSDNPGNLLEIIPAAMLLQKSYYAICPEIVGMAKGREEAMEMAADIVREIYETTGAFKVREYFKNR